ncbi:MAG: hypothetical protein O2887_04525 [Bacteroidetes bacterium]|nr:hypothetical protein [Bacteroidota bacterium]MDA1119750.1 hypothetical protein [Bacteroidota bacterium]
MRNSCSTSVYVKSSAAIVFLLFAIYYVTQAQRIDLEANRIYDSLKIEGAPNETYSLFLPENYNANDTWPVLYIFDPVGRGITGIHAFMDAARAYGYILVCSNNSKNGPLETNFEIASHLFFETLSYLSVDHSRIYAAGFSGGSRLAFALAMQNPIIKGVIGCGAGFPGQNPLVETTFFYLGIVGDLDMNYLEMKKVEEWMDHINVNNHRILFEGNHQWPPKESILKSFQWIELNSMQTGEKAVDNKIILEMYLESYAEAALLHEEDSNYEYVDLLKRITKRFEKLINVDSLHEQITSLESDRKYQKGFSDLTELEDHESELHGYYIGLLKKQLQNPVDTFLTTWKREFRILDSRAASKEEMIVKSTSRTISAIAAWCIETGQFSSSNGDYETAITVNLAWLAVRPKDTYANFRMAKYQAGNGNANKAINYLKRSINNGFRNKAFIINTLEFKPIMDNKNFKKLLSSM